MRVAIYARVSSERQEKEHTIGSQLEALRNYAAQIVPPWIGCATWRSAEDSKCC
jgi:DNA invertase Pin-like site-specific DNA recombinase